MKKFANKSMLQKMIISVLVILLLINFIVPTYSHADAGGVLLSPIIDLVCSLGDAIINLLQRCMMGYWGTEGSGMNFSLSMFMQEKDEYFRRWIY